MTMVQFKHFRDLDQWFSEGKKPRKHRRVSQFEIYPHLDGYQVCLLNRYDKDDIIEAGIWYRDNIFEFTMPEENVFDRKTTLTNVLGKVFPFALRRLGRRRYVVEPPYCYSTVHDYFQIYFAGMQIDCNEWKVVNPRPDPITLVVPEKRKEWVLALQSFRRSLMTKAKLGILDAMIADRHTSRNLYGTDNLEQEVLAALVKGVADNEVIEMYLHTERYYHESRSGMQRAYALMTYISARSIQYRKAFGVFEA